MDADLPPPRGERHTVEEIIRHRLGTALGGPRGSAETALPMVAFVVAWMWRGDLTLALWAAVGVTVALAAARALQRQTLQYVLSSVVATGLAAFFALRSGRAEDAFLPGILGSIAWGTAAFASVVLRWPVVGFMVGAGDPAARDDPFSWRRDPGMVRVCSRLTLVLVGLYVVRVGVMLPLYLVGNVALLGVAKVVLGWPAWLAAVAVMGAILVRGRTPHPAPAAPPDGSGGAREPGVSPRGGA